jgi:hypothetical protein
MHRRLVLATALAALALSPPALGGLFGDGPPGRIPVPARVFRAEVEDRGGTVLRITRVTFDGEVYLFGTIGAAEVTVPFERFTEARFQDGPGEEHRTVVLTDVDGQEVRLVIEADRPIQGATTFGNYRIEAADVRRFTVLGPE